MIKLEKSYYGTPTPTYYLNAEFLKRAGYRQRNAAVYSLASTIEELSPEDEEWVVGVHMDRGCVYLELSEGTEEEAARGMDFLRKMDRT